MARGFYELDGIKYQIGSNDMVIWCSDWAALARKCVAKDSNYRRTFDRGNWGHTTVYVTAEFLSKARVLVDSEARIV